MTRASLWMCPHTGAHVWDLKSGRTASLTTTHQPTVHTTLLRIRSPADATASMIMILGRRRTRLIHANATFERCSLIFYSFFVCVLFVRQLLRSALSNLLSVSICPKWFFLNVVLQQTDLMFLWWIQPLKCFQHVSPPGQGQSLSWEHGSALTQELAQEPVVLLESWMCLCSIVSFCWVHGPRWAREAAESSADSLWSSCCCGSWLGRSASF